MADTTTEPIEMVYIAVKPCGCAAAFVTAEPEMRDYTAKHVQGFIADGYTVERVTREECVRRLGRCEHGNRSAHQLTFAEE